MSVAAASSMLELLEEEALQVRDTIDQVRRRCFHVGDHGGSIAHLADGEVIDLIVKLLLEIDELQKRHQKIVKSEVLSFDTIYEQSPTSRETVLRDMRVALREYEATCWTTRVEENRALVAALHSNAAAELAQLHLADKNAESYSSVQLLQPELPSQPGSGSTSAMSLSKLEEKLRLLNDADSNSSPSGKSFRAEDVATRHLEKLRRQIDLQFQSRHLEGKAFENEPDLFIRATATAVEQREQKELREAVENVTTKPFSDTFQRVVYARQKILHSREGGPQLVPGTELDFTTSEGLRATLQKDISSCNALEGFQGHIKDTQKKMAQLNVVGALQFEVVCSTDYALGKQDPLQPFSLYTPVGSVDHEARLDRRTLFWLLSNSSKKTDGIGCVDGPLHHVYSTMPRTLRPHAYYVSKEPITVGQYLQLISDRRFGNALKDVVSFEMLDPERRPRYTPTLLKGEVNGYRMEYEHRGVEGVDHALEVPYFVAERICEVLGGVVCPLDVWEAGGRGADDPEDARRAFLFTEMKAHKKLIVTRKAWSTQVDDGTREVFGESMRLRRDCVGELSALRSPFRLQGYGRMGCEWNSVLTVDKSLDERRKEAHRLQQIVSRTPTGVSILADPSDDEDKVEQSPSLLRQQSTAVMTIQEPMELREVSPFPTNCVFPPTSHVLRSLTDYGTQIVTEECTTATEQCDGESFTHDEAFLPANHLSFVGMSLPTFALPSGGTFCPPTAAFRLAFPVFPDGQAALDVAKERSRRLVGREINFVELLEGLGREKRHVTCLKQVQLGLHHVDPLYGTKTFHLPAAGVSVTFAAEHPNPMDSFDLYASHSLQRLQVIERDTFAYPIATDNTAPFALPLQEKELALYLDSVRQIGHVQVTNDSDALFSFEDIVTLPWPPGRHALMGPLTVRVEVALHVSSLLDKDVNPIRVVTHLTVKRI